MQEEQCKTKYYAESGKEFQEFKEVSAWTHIASRIARDTGKRSVYKTKTTPEGVVFVFLYNVTRT
jgi:hypothetical protein